MDENWKQVITDICHPTRIQILSVVHECPMSFSHIAARIDLSNSEISRHLNRLFDQGVLKKDAKSRQISLTKFGALIYHALQPLQFYCEYNHIFSNYDILDLPDFLLVNIFLLKHAEIVQGTGPVMFKMQEITGRTKKEIKMMVNQPFPFGKAGVSIKFIVPYELMQLRKKIEKNYNHIDARLYQYVRYSICITDNNEALLFLPKDDTSPDFETCFYVSSAQNPAFDFITQLWDHFWTNGMKSSEI
ncbi:MAG: winged helix-turn-helix domain-containing protein [Promethearchaeota archaeon]